VTITEGPTPTIERDENGNARGGIRLPQLEAPVATLSGEPGGGPGFCSLFGYTAAFDANRLSSLSPTHQDHVKIFSKATDKLQRDGFRPAATPRKPRRRRAGRPSGAEDEGRVERF
jgi:Alpha/beta hydrolase domain